MMPCFPFIMRLLHNLTPRQPGKFNQLFNYKFVIEILTVNVKSENPTSINL